MKQKAAALLPYGIALGIIFYLLPLLMRDTGSAIFLMLCVMPLAALVTGVVCGLRRGFQPLLPVLALLLFVVLPTFLTSLLRPVVASGGLLALAEGGVKVVIFVCYLWLSTRVPDVKRLFCYHGGEHKTIACYEAGEELTVENVRKYPRFHPRCGTSFLFLVLIISILTASLVTWQSALLRMVLKLLQLPVVVGIAYELIKLAGRYTNPVTRLISAPGLLLQRLTTAEPDDSMIEVAIAAMKPAIPADGQSDNW